jgi:hypothetical protein
VTAAFRTTRTPVPAWATGDVCLHGRTAGLVGAGVMEMAQRARGRSFLSQWTSPSIQLKTNVKAFAATQDPGADP